MKSVFYGLSILLCLTVYSQRYKQEISFNSSGDQTVSLGKYRIGTAVRVECKIKGGWAVTDLRITGTGETDRQHPGSATASH